jgi:hypothetical protein
MRRHTRALLTKGVVGTALETRRAGGGKSGQRIRHHLASIVAFRIQT